MGVYRHLSSNSACSPGVWNKLVFEAIVFLYARVNSSIVGYENAPKTANTFKVKVIGFFFPQSYQPKRYRK